MEAPFFEEFTLQTGNGKDVQNLRQEFSNSKKQRRKNDGVEDGEASDVEEHGHVDNSGGLSHPGDESSEFSESHMNDIPVSQEDEQDGRERDDESLGGTGDENSEAEEEDINNPFNPKQTRRRRSTTGRVNEKFRKYRTPTGEVQDPITGFWLPPETLAELRAFRRREAEERGNPPSMKSDSTVRILQSAMAEQLQCLEYDQIICFRDNLLKLKSSNYSVVLDNMIPPRLQAGIEIRFEAQG